MTNSTYKAKAYSAASATSHLASTQIQRREPTEHDIQIEILFCEICHSDLHQVRDEWKEFMPTVYFGIFTGIAIHKSAEPNSLIVHVDPAVRDEMIAEQPDLYYTAAHYENYPCVLVRFSRITRDILEDLLLMAHKYVSSRPRRRRRITKKGRRTKA